MQINNRQFLPVIYSSVFLNAMGYAMTVQLIFKLLREPSYGFISSYALVHGGLYAAAFALGWGSIGAFLGGLSFGSLSDLIGRKYGLLLCTLLCCLSFCLMVAAIELGSLMLLLVGNFVNGIASANQSVTQAYIADIPWRDDRQCSVRMSFVTLAYAAAFVVGPLLGQFLINPHWVPWFRLSTPFITGALLTVLAFVLIAWFLPKDRFYRQPSVQLAYSSAVTKMLVETGSQPQQQSTCALLLLFVISFLFQFVISQFAQYTFPFLASLGFNWNERALLGSFVGIITMVSFAFIYPLWVRYYPVHRILYLSGLLMLLGLIGISLSSSVGIWVWTIPWVIGMACYMPALLAVLNMNSHWRAKGLVYGVNIAMMSIAWYVTAFTGTALGQINNELPLYCNIAILVIVLMIVKRYVVVTPQF